MKRILATSLLILCSCGGGGSGSNTGPQISGLVASGPGLSLDVNGTAFRNSGGHMEGASFLNSSTNSTLVRNSPPPVPNGALFDFLDPDGNLATYTVSFFTSSGDLLSSNQGTIENIAGRTIGKIAVYFPTLLRGSYTCQITVADSAGAVSNSISGNFIVN